jgi:hypothetical protein
MSLASAVERLRHEITAPTNGTIGIVDALLGIARFCDLRMDGASTQLRLTLTGSGEDQIHEFTFKRPLVRALLDRVSVIVSEDDDRNPSDPYGDEGRVTLLGDPPLIRHVRYVNKPGAQTLEVVAQKTNLNGRNGAVPEQNLTPPTEPSRTRD